jgi:hypothetical protein
VAPEVVVYIEISALNMTRVLVGLGSVAPSGKQSSRHPWSPWQISHPD